MNVDVEKLATLRSGDHGNTQKQEKTVRIEIDLPMEFPKGWDDRDIEFYLNESSWCFSNLIELLEKYDEERGCLCGICKAKVLRDASRGDRR